MGEKNDIRDWAIEKVRVFVKPSKEKSTLLAIAKYANRDGTGSWAGIDTLAFDTGHSIRTIQRHIKVLVDRGDLAIIPGGRGPRDTNQYMIPCCQLTRQQLEEITGVGRNQLKLPLVMTDRSIDLVRASLGGLQNVLDAEGVTLSCQLDDLSQKGCQSDAQPSPDLNNDHKIRERLFNECGVRLRPKPEDRSYREEPVTTPMSHETRELWASTLAALGAGMDMTMAVGGEWRVDDD